MKILTFLNLLFFSVFAYAENIEVMKFATTIKESVSNKNIADLKALKCYPESNNCVSERALEYIYNDNGAIHKLLSNKNIKIKIYGPYTYEAKHPNSSYAILFYNPNIVKLSENGQLSEKTEKEQWNKNLTETVVTVINGEVHLNRTIFYFGAHAPWADDYG